VKIREILSRIFFCRGKRDERKKRNERWWI